MAVSDEIIDQYFRLLQPDDKAPTKEAARARAIGWVTSSQPFEPESVEEN